MYRVLGADGKEYGPINADMIRQWLAERRLNAQSQIKQDGTAEWKRLGEFPEFAVAPAAPAAPIAPAAAHPPSLPGSAGPAPVQVRSGLAITSLVLGIFSLCCPVILPAVAAVICGHMAHGRARKSPEQFGGAGMAMGGFITGYVSLLLSVLIALMSLPAMNQARNRATSVSCVSNLKQIGLAARMYSNDHNDTFPKDFLSMSNELYSPKVLHCPADKSKTRAADWTSFTPSRNVSYEYLLPGSAEKDVMNKPVFRCRIHGHTAMGDGSVHQSRKGGW